MQMNYTCKASCPTLDPTGDMHCRCIAPVDCPCGHTAEWEPIDHVDEFFKKKRKAYMRKYYAEHREEHAAYYKEYYQKHREEILARQKRKRQEAKRDG